MYVFIAKVDVKFRSEIGHSFFTMVILLLYLLDEFHQTIVKIFQRISSAYMYVGHLKRSNYVRSYYYFYRCIRNKLNEIYFLQFLDTWTRISVVLILSILT